MWKKSFLKVSCWLKVDSPNLTRLLQLIKLTYHPDQVQTNVWWLTIQPNFIWTINILWNIINISVLSYNPSHNLAAPVMFRRKYTHNKCIYSLNVFIYYKTWLIEVWRNKNFLLTENYRMTTGIKWFILV